MSAAQYSTGRFSWRCHESDSVLYLGFEGELDLQAVPVTWKELERSLAENPKTVVLDMGDLSFIDSSGLRLLIRTRTEVVARQGQLVVSRLSQPVKRLIDVCRLNRWFDPVASAPQGGAPCPVCEAPASAGMDTCPYCGGAI